MGIDIAFQFIDHAVVDPVLELSWKEFLRKYPWRRKELKDEVIGPMPEGETVSSVLANRTLRWTMMHSGPDYLFLNQVIYHVPYLRRRCPWIEVEQNSDIVVITATAVEALLKRKIGDRMFWAVDTICGRQDLRHSLRLSRSESFAVDVALGCGAVEKQMFSWQTNESLSSDEYRSLRVTDTRRFISFLRRAWLENWPASRLNDTERRELAIGHSVTPQFRDFDLPRRLVTCLNAKRIDRPAVYRSFV